jgi:uncharacterized protein (DUF2147 family)
MTIAARMAILAVGLALWPVPAAAKPPITGRWVTGDKDAVVAIAKCGKEMCGRIEKFLTSPAGGDDQRDVNNSDPAKRSRKLIGTVILTGLMVDGDAWRGEIYDPKRGRSFTAEVRPRDAATLEVKGCFGPICQTQVWKKAR